MRCPSCGEGQLDPKGPDGNGMVTCDHCGRPAYIGYVAEAAYLTDLREQTDRRLGWVLHQIRTGAPAPEVERPQVGQAKVGSSAPWLLGLGAALLVVAAMVFTAVVWDRIGAVGQAGILTLIVVATATLAIRLPARLVATSEALAVTSIAVLTIGLLAAPQLGLIPTRVAGWGTWYLPAVFAGVSAAGIVGHRTCGLRAWQVLGWLAAVPSTGTLAIAVARHLDPAHHWHASGFGAVTAIVIGLTLIRTPDTFARVAGGIVLAGTTLASPMAVGVPGARVSWLVAGGLTVAALILVRPSVTSRSWWDVATGAVLGLTAALALLPHNASSLAWAAGAAGVGGGALLAGVAVRRIQVGHGTAGVVWLAWIGGRLIQNLDHHSTTLADQTVIVAAVAAGLLIADAVVNRRPALAWVAAGAGAVAATTASAHAHVATLEAYTLPLAAMLMVAGLVWRSQRASNSVVWCGPAVTMALIPSALATWNDSDSFDLSEPSSVARQHLVRLLAVIVVAGLAAAVGTRLRWRGLLLPAGVALAITAAAEVWATCHVLPEWVVLASVGTGLVLVGARLEWLRDQRTRLDDWAQHLA